MEGFEWLKSRNLKPSHLEKVRRLNDLAKKLDTSLPKLAIAWCVQNPNVSTAILGASRPEQLKETLRSLEVVPLLTPKVNAQIERILQNKPLAPEW
jgi:aryl-alcohol dehydrogenase-like predicted oxidoreductase